MRAKEFLSQNSIHFEERDVHEDADAARILISRNVKGVPAFLIGDDLVAGLDGDRILHLVDHRLVRCDKCSQKLRVPTKKGRIEVTCPKCSNQFSITT